jgi:exosortase B
VTSFPPWRMPITETAETPAPMPAPAQVPMAELLALLLGLLVMYVPAYQMLSDTVWNVVGQGHGPVMLALAVWLAWQRKDKLAQVPAGQATVAGSIALGMGLLWYVLGRSQTFPIFYIASQIWVLAALLLFYKGWQGLKIMWFPLFFIIFITPLPGPLVDAVTGPMKMAVSYASEALLHLANYPVGRAGVTLTIGPYQLLVADACAGLNSIFALEAIGVFYMSAMQYQSGARNVMLALLILPTSFVSNVIRVITLVLVTYYLGDEAGQGFVHDFAGVLLFMVATIVMIGLDALMGMTLFRRSQAAWDQAAASRSKAGDPT